MGSGVMCEESPYSFFGGRLHPLREFIDCLQV